LANASAQACDADMKARSVCSWTMAVELSTICWTLASIALRYSPVTPDQVSSMGFGMAMKAAPG
jgi:hypothetical protein